MQSTQISLGKTLRAFKPTTKHEQNTVMRGDKISIRRYSIPITLQGNDDTDLSTHIADYEPV